MDANEGRTSNRGLWIFAGIFLAIMGVAALWPKLGLGPTSGSSTGNSIINNLRQLDGAIQTWTLEKSVTNVTTAPRWEDLLPYLARKPASVVGEQYVLGRLCDGPSAILTRKYLNYPKGTIVHFTKDGNVEFVEPKTGSR